MSVASGPRSSGSLPPAGIILAAGKGTRMRSRTPKVLFPMLGRRLLDYPMELLAGLDCQHRVVVIGSGAEEVRASYPQKELSFALQEPPRGTGDATMQGLLALPEGASEEVVILNGDVPLLSLATLTSMLAEHRQQSSDFTLLTTTVKNPRGYGRVVRSASGELQGVVEDADASPAEKRINEINGGIYVARRSPLLAALKAMDEQPQNNAQGELYLPPALDGIRSQGGRAATWLLPEDQQWQLQGINTRVDLAEASSLRQGHILEQLMEAGVTVVDPRNTHIEEGVTVGQDTVIHPFTVIRSGVSIGKDCSIGPFTHLRVGTDMADTSEVGNFTEVKNTRLGAGSKAKHLSYLGDGRLGERVNIGAGTILANFDGKKKSLTEIGDGAFIGSGTILVAPVNIGAGSSTGAGAVVTRGRDVPDGDTVVGVPARSLGKPLKQAENPEAEIPEATE